MSSKMLQEYHTAKVNNKLMKSVEKISKEYASEIERLIDLQFQQEPFSEMKLPSVDILRAKTCLAIYNFAYFIFYINPYLEDEQDRFKKIIELTYHYFYKNLQQKYGHSQIIFSEIVINPKEQIEIIRIAREWGMNYGIYVKTVSHNLFPILYEYRIPNYLKNIDQSLRNVENNIMMPFTPVVHQFSDEFLKDFNSEFAVKFEFVIDSETKIIIKKMIMNVLMNL